MAARSCSYSTVIGGPLNKALGTNSLAAGHNAVASHDFSAVLGFDSGSGCASMGSGTVNVCVVAGGFFVNGMELGSAVNVTTLEAFYVNADNRLTELETADADARLSALEAFDSQLRGNDTALQQQLNSHGADIGALELVDALLVANDTALQQQLDSHAAGIAALELVRS